jgi:predicted transcriptional regulator
MSCGAGINHSRPLRKPRLKYRVEDTNMAYQLPPDIDQRVQSQIALGIYQTPDQVLNEALDALELRNADFEAIKAGIEDEQAGRMRPLEDVVREMREQDGLPHRQ